MKNLLYFFLTLFVFSKLEAQGVLPVQRYYNRNIPTYTWDNTSGNAQIDNSSGTWNTTNLTWVQTPPAGTNLAWKQSYNAIFGGNLGVSAAGTVTVSGTQSVQSFTFNPTPSGNFTITGGVLNLLGGLVQVNQNASISSSLQGGGNFLKRGNAILTLTGNNTFTGNMTISQGGLWLGSSTAAGSTAIILGDVQTGNNNIEWKWRGSFTPNNALMVTNNGAGTVTIGTYSSGTNTNHNGTINLNRSVVFYDGTTDRTSFSGKISGNASLITIDGIGTWNASIGSGARITFDNNTNDFIGNIVVLTGKALQFNGVTVVNNQPIEVNGNLVLNVGAGNTGKMGTLTGASTGICEIHYLVASNQTLSVGNDNGSGTFNGVIRNGIGGKVMNLRKEGIGVQTLTGAHTYTGSTNANLGTLVFTQMPTSAIFNATVSNTAPSSSTNSGSITMPNAPNLTGKIFNIVLTESGTGISYFPITWQGTAAGTPTLQVNGAARTSGVAANGTTVTYLPGSGIRVTR